MIPTVFVQVTLYLCKFVWVCLCQFQYSISVSYVSMYKPACTYRFSRVCVCVCYMMVTSWTGKLCHLGLENRGLWKVSQKLTCFWKTLCLPGEDTGPALPLRTWWTESAGVYQEGEAFLMVEWIRENVNMLILMLKSLKMNFMCVYIYIYIYMYVCIYMCIYICMCVCVCVYVYVCMYMYYVYIYVCMYMWGDSSSVKADW